MCESSVPLSRHSQEVPSLSPESAAWDFIRGLSPDAILSATPPRVVQTINPELKCQFEACCAIALCKISLDLGDETAWKLSHLIPRMLLQPPPRGGKSGLKETKLLFDKFLDSKWKDLVNLNDTRSPKKPGCKDDQKNKQLSG